MKFVFVLVTFLSIQFAFAQEEDRLKLLEQRIKNQQQVLKELEQKLEERQEISQHYTQEIVKEYMETHTQEEGIIAGYDKGFFIKSADGDYLFKVNGYLRFHAIFTEANTNINNSIIPSEARIDFHFFFKKDWHVRIRPDFAANGSLREGYLEYLGIPSFKPRAGAFIVPFSREYMEAPSSLLSIMYSPYLTSMPLRDVGLSFFGNGLPFIPLGSASDYFGYEIAIMNGDGMNTLNVDDDLMYVFNTTIYPLSNKEKNVYLHASFMLSDTSYRATGARMNIISLRGSSHSVFGGVDNNGIARNEDDTKGSQIGANFAFRYWKNNIRIEGEVLWARFDREESSRGRIMGNLSPLDTLGAYLAASYFIPIGDPEKSMGVEPLIKVSYSDVDDIGRRKGKVSGQEVWEFTTGFKFHFNKHFRADFNWVMYDLDKTEDYSTRDHPDGSIIHGFIFQLCMMW